MEERLDTVVIGAGLSGLCAAWQLERRGHRVAVFEARERVGGRTWSHRLSDGTIVERGGEFIAPTQTAIRELCGELGLELVPHGFSFDRRIAPDGVQPTPAELSRVSAAAVDAARRLTADGPDVSVASAFAAALDADPLESPIYRRLATSATVPLHRVSARWFCQIGAHGYDDADRVLGGNQRIALELARRLSQPVRTATPVVAVRQREGGVEVVDNGGSVSTAASVVLAVPLPLLAEVQLDPPLPAATREALDHTLFGDAAKLHLPLAAGAPPRGVAAADELWWTWNSAAPHASESGPALSAFAGGRTTVDHLGVPAGADQWARSAAALRPELKVNGEPLLTHWGAERWSAGSYSAAGVGWRPEHDREWRRGHGRMVLAGEHTAGVDAASMNGAVVAGCRAAADVHALLTGK